MKHIISSQQFTRANLEYIIEESRQMENLLTHQSSALFDKKIMATLFYEPSTRTRLSFETAMHRLGGKVISETNTIASSQSKGETLADSIHIISAYADIIVIRSKNIGDAFLASQNSRVPVINAGDGSGEHPTQALLDLYTMVKEFPQILSDVPIHVTFVGDLLYARTVHSTSILLRHFPNISISFISPQTLTIPKQYTRGSDFIGHILDDELIHRSDVIYMTRVQKERFENSEDYEAIRNQFICDEGLVAKMKEKSIIMHPLPRVNEISVEVDVLPQARYFQQASNGVPVRMALIKYCLEG